MGSGWPGYVERDEMAFNGPHVGHPILRYKREPHRPHRPWWVTIGRLSSDPNDELWTCSRMVVRAIRDVLDYERGWFDTYLSKADLAYDKPFVTKSLGEQLLCESINGANFSRAKFNWTLHSRDVSYMNGMITERVFDLLIEEGVLHNPRAHDFRPVTKYRIAGIGDNTKPVGRKRVWAVDHEAADLWLSTRLLLLEDNKR